MSQVTKPYNIDLSSGRDSTIDCLRGVAALMVVAVHVIGSSEVCSEFLHTTGQFGQLGVQLFFVLSAYTLSNSLSNSLGKGTISLTRSKYLSFMIKRYFRIAPLFYFGLAIYFLFRIYIGGTLQYSFLSISSNVLLLHGLYLTPLASNAVPGGWTIGAEFIFYLIFPFIFIWVRGKPKRFAFLASASVLFAVLAAIIVYVIAGKPFNITNNGQMYMAISTQFPCFVTGMFAYYIIDHKTRSILKSSYLNLFFSIITATFVVNFWLSNYLQSIKYLLIPSISGLCFFFLLCGLLQLRPKWPSIFPEIGKRSYSIYIVHFVFVYLLARYIPAELADRGVNGDLATIISFASITSITFILAGYTFKFIEKPFIDIGHSLSKNLVSSKSRKLIN